MDLSRPKGGRFGKEFGGLGHASHQNGLDIDILYPRKDGTETRPMKPSQVDRELAQELVDRFVEAGAVKVFVGPRLHLHGPRKVVTPLIYHDDHLHVRIR
jgi:murein endopeptidase